MDFVRIKFGTNEPLPVEHLFSSLIGQLAKPTANQPKKCSTDRGSEVTSYKIYTLVVV